MAGDRSVGVLVWFCDSFTSCHGLGDRLDEYQHVNWTTRLTDVTWVHSNIPALQALLLNPSFADSPILPLLSAIDPASLPGCLTHYLFRPTTHLQQSIDKLLPDSPQGNATTVSVQIRLGDATLAGRQIGDEAAGWKWHEQQLDSLIGLSFGYPLRFFIASDSTRAREHFVIKLSHYGSVFASEEPPSHLDKPSRRPLSPAGFFAYEGRAQAARLALDSTLAEVSFRT
ncbi:hypothetical protein RQP46_001932 [Phenoliferia psychrophenolica]